MKFKFSLKWNFFYIVFVFGFSVGAAFAQNQIRSVRGQVVSGIETITIEATDVLAVEPVHFSTNAPARIALDFSGVHSGLARTPMSVGKNPDQFHGSGNP